jgi:predicted PurR-regulated permease PerM
VFVFVLLKVMGVKNAIAIAIFAGLTDVIPFVGGLIASAPVIAAVASKGFGAVIVVGCIAETERQQVERVLVVLDDQHRDVLEGTSHSHPRRLPRLW